MTFSKEVTVIPTNSDQQGPKRAVKEVANLEYGKIVSNNGPPARNTRSRFAAAAAASLAVMASVTQADAHQWEHRNHTTMPNKLELNEIANAVLERDKVLKYRQLIQHPVIGEQWRYSSANEFGRLAQGIGGRIKGTDTVKCMQKNQVPDERMKHVTHGQFICNVRSEKDEKNRTRCVVGGNRINYPGDVGTPTEDMLLAKIRFNSVISTNNARFMTGDIKNFYLNTPLKRRDTSK